MTIAEAKQLAEEYAQEQQTEYMEQVDLRDPAEMEAAEQVYNEAYKQRLNQLITGIELKLI